MNELLTMSGVIQPITIGIIVILLSRELETLLPIWSKKIILFSSKRLLLKSVQKKLNKNGQPSGEAMYEFYRSLIHECSGRELTRLFVASQSIKTALSLNASHLIDLYIPRLPIKPLRTILVILFILTLAISASSSSNSQIDSNPVPQIQPSFQDADIMLANNWETKVKRTPGNIQPLLSPKIKPSKKQANSGSHFNTEASQPTYNSNKLLIIENVFEVLNAFRKVSLWNTVLATFLLLLIFSQIIRKKHMISFRHNVVG